ncbi:MAG: transglycosylase SLT domain-containing protein [Oxalobacteraceae bacterium]|jgi:membrane-bound lytic murein transglycosylase D|nr:transglycosylase SLT domain-containing protein [Oxalobacteraceae bacterium]
MRHSQLVELTKLTFICVLTLSSSIVRGNDLTIAPNSTTIDRSELIKDFEREPVGLDGVSLPPDYAAQLEDIPIENFDLWDRIRKGYAIPDLNNPLVATQTTWYSSRPEYLQRISQRASRYLFHVVQELEKRKMPTEIALLPFIESAFNPQAFSSAKAAGMWQFIPSTGRDYNLKQNAFRDERRDVLASTNAALNYLQKLYGMFGDWQLALAAYNWGEGSVSRAIAKAEAAGRPTDFNGLSAFMPAETRNYYPKLQAVKNIIATPAQYGVKLPMVENQPYFVSIKKTRDIDVKLAAQLAELPMEEFRALNPQFNRPVITGSPTTQILLPESNAEKFKENLSNWTKALSSWTAHKVTAARERIESIAARFKTTPEIIREANSIPANMHPKAGSTVLVPKLASAPDKDISQDIADNAMLSVEADEPPRKKISVKVSKRDTIDSIAKRYKVKVAEIRQWNDMKNDKLSPGQSLKLEVRAPKKAKVKSDKGVDSKRPAHGKSEHQRQQRN